MIYDERNRKNLNLLADNTKVKAYQLYQYCIDNKIEVLIYETIRTKEKQKENVAKGASKTMKSYHLVGQALDWALVDDKKNALWNGYKTVNAQKVIKYAKSIGFVSGYDWGWDAPHLQYEYKGYGTDTFGKIKVTEIVKDDGELKFKSSTLKKEYEETVKSKSRQETIVNFAVKNGLSSNWKTDLKANKVEDGDILMLAVMSILKCSD